MQVKLNAPVKNLIKKLLFFHMLCGPLSFSVLVKFQEGRRNKEFLFSKAWWIEWIQSHACR